MAKTDSMANTDLPLPCRPAAGSTSPFRGGSLVGCAAVVVLMGFLAGCGSHQAPSQLDLHFTVGAKLPVSRFDWLAGRPTSFLVDEQTGTCQGSAGFASFDAQTPISILDQHNHELASGRLGPGQAEVAQPGPSGQPRYQACHFRVNLPLSGPARIYTIRLADERYVRREHLSTLAKAGGRLHYVTD